MPYELTRSTVFFALCLPCAAQTMGTGTIRGTVSDPSGAVVSGASVKAINQSTQVARSTAANAGGVYVIPNLQVGKYTITASSPGFQTLTLENIDVDVDTNATVDLTLRVGNSEQSMTVTARPRSCRPPVEN